MKKILQYVLLLIVAIIISKFSFEIILKHQMIISSLLYVSVLLAIGVACWLKIYLRFRNKVVTYIYFFISNFVFILLLGSFLTNGPLVYAYSYLIVILCSIYQLYRLTKIIKIDEEIPR